jgi:hypothetical protein
MSLQTHLSELERKHQALEDAIHSKSTSPSGDALELAEMKRKKLQLKDEIMRVKAGLQSKTTVH